MRRAAAVGIGMVLAAAFSPPRAGAQQFDSEVAFLTIPVGARPVGMGRAVTAVAGDIQAALWNPAILATLDRSSAAVSRYQGPLSFRVHQLSGSSGVGKLGRWGVSLNVQTFGDVPLTREDSPDVVVGTISPSNLVVSVSYAVAIARPLSVGFSGKFIRSRLIGEFEGSTVGFDAGALLQPWSSLPLRFGVSVLNVGPDLQVGDAPADKLPTRLRVGGMAEVLEATGLSAPLALFVTFDVEQALRYAKARSEYVGVELGLTRLVFLRGGLIWETLLETNRGGSVGLGVRIRGVQLDFARELGVNALGDESHISLGVEF